MARPTPTSGVAHVLLGLRRVFNDPRQALELLSLAGETPATLQRREMLGRLNPITNRLDRQAPLPRDVRFALMLLVVIVTGVAMLAAQFLPSLDLISSGTRQHLVRLIMTWLLLYLGATAALPSTAETVRSRLGPAPFYFLAGAAFVYALAPLPETFRSSLVFALVGGAAVSVAARTAWPTWWVSDRNRHGETLLLFAALVLLAVAATFAPHALRSLVGGCALSALVIHLFDITSWPWWANQRPQIHKMPAILVTVWWVHVMARRLLLAESVQRRVGSWRQRVEWDLHDRIERAAAAIEALYPTRRLPNAKRKSTATLAAALQLSEAELAATDLSYTVRYVSKRSGGTRVLHVPNHQLMKIQRDIHQHFLKRLRVHDCAFAYRRGASSSLHAAQHVSSEAVVRVDLRDFFGNIREARARAYFVRIGWSQTAADLLVRLTFHQGTLPQGAPTSPVLSNLLNYRLDYRMERMAARLGARYTRYSDDLVFSWPRNKRPRIGELLRRSRFIIESEGYRVNRKKTAVMRKTGRQLVSGLVVNEGLNVTRSKRRELRAAQHYESTGRPSMMTDRQLRGHEAYHASVGKLRDSLAASGAAAPTPQVRLPFGSKSK